MATQIEIPRVLIVTLLSGDNEVGLLGQPLRTTQGTDVRKERTSSRERAITILSNRNVNERLKVVVITDEEILKVKNYPLLHFVRAFVQRGGMAFFGNHFARCGGDAADKMFYEEFGLTWKHFGPFKLQGRYNMGCSLPEGNSMQLNKYEHNIVFNTDMVGLTEVQSSDIVLAAFPVAKGLKGCPIALIAGGQVGQGYVAYFANVDKNQTCNEIAAQLCGYAV